MKNLYSLSKLLSKDEFAKISKALQKSWSKDSATFADTSKQWDKTNPPRGQCLVTAVLINDLFGGKLAYDRKNHHFWNELPDKIQQDFTRSQFKNAVKLTLTKYKIKDEVLNDEHAKKHKTAEKYKLFKQKFEKAYYG